MQDVTITELVSNLSFKAKIDNPPETKQNYTTVYIDEQEVKRPTVTELTGFIEIKVQNPNVDTTNFLTYWKNSKKRIDLMMETDVSMYFLKGCSIKSFESPKKPFSVFYNNFKQA